MQCAHAAGLALLLTAPSLPAGTQPAFATFIGDSSSDYQVARIRTDAAGDTYIAGTRVSGSLAEVFVTRLDPSGNITAFATMSGKGSDGAADMALDAAGNIYVAGSTSSTLFPLRGALQTTPGPGFLAKISPDLSQLLYATYFPAAITALAIDSTGNMYVTGSTTSSAFPVTAGLPAGSPNFRFSGAFLTKIAAAGDRIVYSALLVGSGKNCGCCSSCFLSTRSTAGVAIAVDSAGGAYVAGDTDTYDLPTTPGALAPSGTGAFVVKVNAAGTALEYLTYIGSTYYPQVPNTNAANTATAIAVDAAGFAYVAGRTFDPSFPATPGVFQTAYQGPSYTSGDYLDMHSIPPPDAFVLKLKPDGSGAVWGTYLGGQAADAAASLALDPSGGVWIAGTTASADFPNAQGWSAGGDFIAGLNSSGTALRYAARYPTGCVGKSLAVDPSGAVHAAGPGGLVAAIAPDSAAGTQIFGVANAAYGLLGGRVAPGLISIYGSHIGPAVPVAAPAGALALPLSLGGVSVMANGNAMPLLYVSDGQINAVSNLVDQPAALRVVNNSATSPGFPAAAVFADPEIFQNADGTAAAINQDGTVNSAAHPAPPGSVVAIWATGVYTSDSYDGSIATTAVDYDCCQVLEFNNALEVLYSGAAPGAAKGVVQVNFRVPADAQNSVIVALQAGGQSSSPVTVYVTP